MKLAPESKSYESWKQPPFPLSLDIYMFNWTNPDDFKNLSTKPKFQQLGPYRFTEKPDKVDITWNPNSTITYRKLSLFFFDEDGSQGSLDDVITSVNVVALVSKINFIFIISFMIIISSNYFIILFLYYLQSAAEKGRFSDYIRAKSIALGLKLYDQQIHVTKTAGEMLFDGYEDDMISLAKQLPFFAGEEVPFDRVGWFYMRNNSADLTGWYNVDTGETDITQIGKLKYWNYEDTNGAFEDECGQLKGSAGEFYPPHLTKNDEISLFTPDMCRSIPLDFTEEVSIHGIDGFKFTGGDRSVDNGTKYPENWCYSVGERVPSGTLNISSCRFGTPVFMSYPHFYNADPYYLNLLEGMKPEKDKHELYMTLEPVKYSLSYLNFYKNNISNFLTQQTTGIALDVAARLQLNLLIRPNPQMALYADVPQVFMPILWFEQRVTLTKDLASEISMALSIPQTGQICAIIVIIIGLIMLLWFPVHRCVRRKVVQVHSVDNKNNVNVLTIDGLEKQDKQQQQPEGDPLIEKNNLRNVELKPLSIKDSLKQSYDKIPYIDEKVPSMTLLPQDSLTITHGGEPKKL